MHRLMQASESGHLTSYSRPCKLWTITVKMWRETSHQIRRYGGDIQSHEVLLFNRVVFPARDLHAA